MRSSESKRVLLCDLGGVLVEFSFDLAIEYWASTSGRDGSALRRGSVLTTSSKPLKPGGSRPRATLTTSASLALDLPDAEMASGWNAIYFGVNQEVLNLLEELRGTGVRVVGVTNTNPVHLAHWFPWYQRDFPVFDELYISAHMRCRKPEPRFFEVVLRAEGIGDDDLVVFVDDGEQNVMGARRFGIDGFVFHDPDQMREELRERGLL